MRPFAATPDLNGYERAFGFFPDTSATNVTSLFPQTTDLPLQGRRLLVVEDEAFIAIDLQYLLEDAGAHVIDICVDNVSTLATLRTQRPDAVLMDFRLADGEAHPSARCAQELGVPVVFHSGHVSARELADRYPGTRVLSKPARGEAICAALVAVMGGPL